MAQKNTKQNGWESSKEKQLVDQEHNKSSKQADKSHTGYQSPKNIPNSQKETHLTEADHRRGSHNSEKK
ncbi:hypothetical protein Noda2021_04240 [Candidatus Dependentiae bacterium Noda2021]|nr:hypothetical protein Noda2021_04240 [Candidatus Dependentiae bacterium Noda2021]